MEYSSNPSSNLGQSYATQRTVPRYSILAIAEFVEDAGTMCIVGRMTEISRHGCYVNTPSTLPVNTLLKVIITRDDETFMTNCRVIYTHERIGMGIGFVDSAEEQLQVLKSWLADAADTEVQ